MDGSFDASIDREALRIDAFPDGLSAGRTILIASAGNPSQYNVDLRALCRYGGADDTALIVTTIERADQILETYGRLCSTSDRPSLRLVDTTSEQQFVSALYDETPVVYTPSPDDLERLILALSDLSENRPPASGARHFVARSLTPLLATTPTARVCTVLERISGLRSETGLCLLGLDYTAHDEETMRTVAERVDGILWITHGSTGLEFEYRPSSGRHNRIQLRSGSEN